MLLRRAPRLLRLLLLYYAASPCFDAAIISPARCLMPRTPCLLIRFDADAILMLMLLPLLCHTLICLLLLLDIDAIMLSAAIIIDMMLIAAICRLLRLLDMFR